MDPVGTQDAADIAQDDTGLAGRSLNIAVIGGLVGDEAVLLAIGEASPDRPGGHDVIVWWCYRA